MKITSAWAVRITLYLIVTGLVAGCELKMDIDLPRQAPAVTVNGLFFPDYEFELCLSESRDLVDGERSIQIIEDAVVELWEGDRMLEVIPYVGECLYRTPSRRPEPGAEYTIRVTAEGYLDVTATDVVPVAVPAEFEYEVDTEGTDAGSVDVTMTFHDPPGEGNLFRIMAWHTEPTGAYSFAPTGFRTDDESINAENQGLLDTNGNGEFETAWISDRLLEHGPDGHTIHFSFSKPTVWGGPAYEGSFDAILVVALDHISENLHEYGISEWAHRSNGDNPFAEPVLVYSNVENGYGIFGGFSRSSMSVEVEAFYDFGDFGVRKGPKPQVPSP